MNRIFKFSVSAFLGTLFVFSGYANAYETANARQTYVAPKSKRGTTVTIPIKTIEDLCGDLDGCTLRLGMYDWDGTGKTASRESLFYYNKSNRQWRASAGDKSGRTRNKVTQHVMHAWACYFTDGEYASWINRGDFSKDFGLLSWNQYRAACRLTIID